MRLDEERQFNEVMEEIYQEIDQQKYNEGKQEGYKLGRRQEMLESQDYIVEQSMKHYTEGMASGSLYTISAVLILLAIYNTVI